MSRSRLGTISGPGGIVPVTGLLVLALAVGPDSLTAQRDDEQLPDTSRFVPLSVRLDARLSGIQDSNLLHDDTDALATQGVRGGLRLRIQSRPVRPSLTLQWEWEVRRFEGSERFDRNTQRLSADLRRDLGPVRVRSRGSIDFNGTTEDRELASIYLLRPELSLDLEPVTVGVEGRLRRKRLSGGSGDTEDLVGAEAFAEVEWPLGEWGLAYRYEQADAEDPRRRFERRRVTVEHRADLGDRFELTLESSSRRRLYTERLVSIEGRDLPTLDRRWTIGGRLRYRSERGREVALEYEGQARTSNDLDRSFDAHRVSVSLLLPLLQPPER